MFGMTKPTRRERLAKIEELLRAHPNAGRWWYWRIQAKILRFILSVYGDAPSPFASGGSREGRLLAPIPQQTRAPKPPSALHAILVRIAAVNRWRLWGGEGDDSDAETEGFSWARVAYALGALVIVALLVLFIADALPTEKLDVARRAAAERELSVLESSIRLYAADCGAPPSESQGLAALLNDPDAPGWNGPYVEGAKLLTDPWGRPYRYCLIEGKPVLDSAGPDLEFARNRKGVERMNKDEEHLRLLSVFHYVAGGLAGVFALFPVIHLTLGLVMIFAPDKMGPNGPPAAIGWIFVAIACAVMLAGLAVAALMIANGVCLARRRRYTFCLIAAGVSCIFMPIGTVLGVFTIIVLMRPAVRELFGAASPDAGSAV
jgi:hypothetical protein